MLCPENYDFSAHIHQYSWGGLYICLDVNSGAVHLLDEVGWRLVSLIADHHGDGQAAVEACAREFPLDEVQAAFHEIQQTVIQEALFTLPESLELDYSALSIKALCLNVAHRCNMNCRYCFASQGDFGRGEALMSSEIGRQAIDFLLEQSGSVRQVEVDFFGGEPLLNPRVIRDVVDYGEEQAARIGKKIHFTLTTNAVLLDQAMNDFIIDKGISVVLSLDGRPEINDYNRKMKNGSGSYDLVLPRIKALVQRQPVSHYIRGTFTRDTLDFASDFQHLVELGFESISLEPAVGPHKDFAIREEDLPAVLSEYERLVEILWNYQQEGKEISFFHLQLDLLRGPCLAKRLTGCGAGVEYLAVTPEGDLYPCHQLVGQDQFFMGNVGGSGINWHIKKIFASNHLIGKEECRHCWGRYFCGGGCHANNYLANQALNRPHAVTCAMHRKRIEAGIYLHARTVMGKK
ncbi:MAG TPA: thioether cross-link-forming SCIFF peptide maturase [Syntrophomonadaceae bacterium]|nr:thioether cross-link-forming SCIFF peptide maturase [Syntrophomonadaceae bacterium]